MAEDLIVITGAPRSGTSLTCQALDALGVDFGGPLIGPHRTNPHGFWEHAKVRAEVTKPTLKRMGFDPAGQHPLPPVWWEPLGSEVQAYREAMDEALGDAEAVKDPKLLLLWPLIRAAYPSARWVWVLRPVEEVVRSLGRVRWFRGGANRTRGRAYVVELLERVRRASAAVGGTVVCPNPSAPGLSFRGLAKGLGLEWDREAVEAVCDPGIWGKSA